MNVKEDWIKQLKEDKLKYFVLKCDEFLASLTEEDIYVFNNFLNIYENYRIKKGKDPFNLYYVVNRDDVPHIKNVNQFLNIIGYDKNNS